ncbi:aminoglycoside phosphotransferase family protein [Corynebacterium auriscanis]|uniref:aminoglycoside phosphotransferase family protein n=1 Tax=Corynebacterium auriscanis TaxID=99807 RepID=UPI003CEE7529
MVALKKLPDMVRRTWRDLSWTSEEVPEQGMDHAVMILRGITSAEGELQGMVPESTVVRVPHEPEYRDQAPLESALISQLFRGSSVRVPETVRQAYARGTFNTPNPVMLTLQTEVTGVPLTKELWATLSDSQREWAAEQLGSLLASMHTMDPDLLPVSRVECWWSDGPATSTLNESPRTLPGKMALMKSRMADFLAPNLTSREMDAVEENFAQVDALLARPHQQRCLTHSDLFQSHLLWSRDGGVGVIDFSDMTVGDPAVDYCHFVDIDSGLQERVLQLALENGPEDLYQVSEGVPRLLERARIFKQWDNIFLLIDHYRTGRSPRVELL